MNASVLLLAVLACAAPPSGDPTPARVALTVGEVDSLRRARDFFELRDRLHAGSDTAGVAGRLARTIVAHAFNRPEESSAVIAALRTGPALPDSLRWWLMQLEVSNHVRRHRDAGALRSADVALAQADGVARPDEIQAAENIRRLLRALTGVPPQEVHATGPTSLPLRDGRIPVTVGDSAREYVFDTGANLSTIMRSEAEGLGLDIRPAGLRVGTSTDAVITADVGIANRLTIGSIDVRTPSFSCSLIRSSRFPTTPASPESSAFQ